ncbi:MAG: hypothetical protein J6W16_01530 [Methanobrevibacter sp.]|nr:hypothetical protein [Methanobrevibacter sp.]MBP5784250.1 hypothetical protein [Methanobrevibacter sp.]
MEIKDIMEQQMIETQRLTILRDMLVERMKEYEREHPEKADADTRVFIINNKPNFGLKLIDDITSQKYNMIIEWLTEDMTERELHDLYENNKFLDFWEDFKRKAQYSQEQFIKELDGNKLNKLYIALKHSDILEVAYNRFEKEINTWKEEQVEDGEAKNDN